LRTLSLLALLGLAACDPVVSDQLVDPDPDTDTEAPAAFDLSEAVTVDAMVGHLEVLQGIADDNDGTRVYLSQGYLDSTSYVADLLEDAGYDVTIDEYPVTRYEVLGASMQVVAGPEALLGELDGQLFTYTGGGAGLDVPLVAVDLQLPPARDPNSSTSGCEASDFDGFPAGSAALIQRGSCNFSTKAALAADAGAVAVIIFNEGQEGRTGVVSGTLDSSGPSAVPVVGTSFAIGEALANAEDVLISFDIEVLFNEVFDRNVVVELPGADTSRAVLVGAHLDSVRVGAGINDNGSGSAFLLEMALQAAAADWTPARTLRFGWWGAEEQGLIGSRNYFLDGDEPAPEVLDLEAYLNFDMIASNNGGRFIYDGDGSTADRDGVGPGSALIEELFYEHFDARQLEVSEVPMVVRSDSAWSAMLGIPTGGLFSGAEGEKTQGEAGLFGGDAGQAYDACYHQRCDRLDFIDPVLYEELAKAGAAVTQQLAEREGPMPMMAVDTPIAEVPKPLGCHDELAFDR
jgi:Zn-dependent M28 family amino/carboxypeptidase